MWSWNFRKDAENALEEDISEILHLTQESGVPLIFGHLCCGVQDKPGALRISDIKPRENSGCFLESLAREPSLHREAFRNHIKRFGREGTLLDWLSLKAYIESREEADRRLRRYWLAFLVRNCDDPIDVEPQQEGCIITLSEAFIKQLVPETFRKYLVYLYKSLDPSLTDRDSVRQKYLEGHLLASRYFAYSYLGNRHKRRIHSLAQLYKKAQINKFANLDIKTLAWIYLGALQTAFIYTKAAEGENEHSDNLVGFISGITIYCDEPGTNILHLPLSLVSAVLSDMSSMDQVRDYIFEVLTDTTRKGLASFVRNIGNKKGIAKALSLHDSLKQHWPGITIHHSLDIRLEDLFASNVFPNWAKSAALLLSLIIEWLRGAVHEGIPLNFCLVLADISQVKDSPAFELVPLSDYQLGRPWKRNGELRTEVIPALNDITRQISKNNYSWFQEGRYALLWDATFPESEPKYLLRLVDSSWDVFVTSCRHGQQASTSSVAVVVAYIKADGSGGIIVSGQPMLSFRRSGDWTGPSSASRTWLMNRFKQSGLQDQDDIHNANVKKLAEACLAISEDPYMGAMIIVFDPENGPYDEDNIPFEKMGTLWRAESVMDLKTASAGELISLMAMDGATCVFKDASNKIRLAFRRLAKVSNDQLERTLSTRTKNFLDGEGSRKWSAALAACRHDVNIVLAISQDGPIIAFIPDQDSNIVKHEYKNRQTH